MKRFLLLLAIAATALCVTRCYDDTTLKNDISDLQSRVKTLEDQVKALNGNISTLQTLVNGLNSKVFVNSVTETGDGCVLTFSDGQSAYIRNGKDGADGKDGKDGANGKDGDSFFKDVTWDDNYVYVTLADGTGLSLTRGANGVKAIAVVPDVEDGAVLCVLNEFAIRFDVLPKAAADAIVSMDPESLKVNVVYAQTKADLGEELSLPVSSVRGTDGRITVIVDGSALGEDFAIGKIGACASHRYSRFASWPPGGVPCDAASQAAVSES
jgi:hypothetical protein